MPGVADAAAGGSASPSCAASAASAASDPAAPPPGPLAGLRVVEFARNVAGPFCGQALGDMGAEVVKVEQPPRGDPARGHGPPFVGGESPYFLSLNRNKRSVVIDCKHPAGREVALRLLSTADVLLHNLRPGAMDRLGLGHSAAAERNPRLIYCHVSGYGRTGPWATRPAYDQILQGMSGLMSVTGDPATGRVYRVGVAIGDVLTGAMAAFGVVCALLARQSTGRGQEVDASLLASLLASLTFQSGRYFATGERPVPQGNDHPTIWPYGTFAAADGPLNICVGNDAMFERFAEALAAREWAADPRFATNALRVQHRGALRNLIEARLATDARASWVERLAAAGVAAGPILGVDEVFAHAQVVAQGLVATMQHSRAGAVRAVGPAVGLSQTPASVRRPPPALGEHTDEVLAELGHTPAEVAALRASGAVG